MIYVHVVVRRHSTECTEHINLFAELVFKTVAMFSGAAEGGAEDKGTVTRREDFLLMWNRPIFVLPKLNFYGGIRQSRRKRSDGSAKVLFQSSFGRWL